MQFTESPVPPNSWPQQNPIQMNKTRLRDPAISITKPVCGDGAFSVAAAAFGDTNCMEQLLIHCANAIESNDATLAQQILWVLNNIAPSDGDSSQRLTAAFLRALVSRAVAKSPSLAAAVANSSNSSNNDNNGNLIAASKIHSFSVIELAGFVDLTPWHRFGFTVANAAILDAVEGFSTVHVIDISLTHCMQIPTLIDAMASRLEKPPVLKLTVIAAADSPPPFLNVSYDELGSKLVNFASTRNITMEFRTIPSNCSDGFSGVFDQLRKYPFVIDEAVVVNCHMMLHYVPDETLTLNANAKSLRTVFLKEIRELNPTLVILVDEDADFTSENLVGRIRSAFNYLWIPYDAVDTYLPCGSRQRQWYEANMGWRVENVVACEGAARVERAETKGRWGRRMAAAGFTGGGFSEEVAAEVRGMLVEQHATGWGVKRDDDGSLVMTWKGHNVVFATAWVPNAF